MVDSRKMRERKMDKEKLIAICLAVWLSVSATCAAAQTMDTVSGRGVDALEEYRQLGIGLLLKEGQEYLLSGMEDNSHILRAEKGATAMVELTEQLDEAFTLFDDGKHEQAFEAFLATARAGSPEAQEMVGMMFAQGLGIEEDQAQALRWLERAAQNFQPLSMHHVGIRYFSGQGVRRDLQRGVMWVFLATDLYGEDDSPEATRARQDLENMMARLSLREQRQVQNAVREWKEENRTAWRTIERQRQQQEQMRQMQRQQSTQDSE